jgi:hypothetical protein
MASGIKWNPGWEDDLSRQINGQFQKASDKVFNRYAGRPVADVKDAITREWKRIGASITDPELTKFATAISEGKRLKFS